MFLDGLPLGNLQFVPVRCFCKISNSMPTHTNPAPDCKGQAVAVSWARLWCLLCELATRIHYEDPHLVALYLQMIKYGVVGMPALQQDLQHWSHLYVAGRLHKPVAVLTSQPAAEAAYQRNLRAALSTALLLMSQQESSFKVSIGEQ